MAMHSHQRKNLFSSLGQIEQTDKKNNNNNHFEIASSSAIVDIPRGTPQKMQSLQFSDADDSSMVFNNHNNLKLPLPKN